LRRRASVVAVAASVRRSCARIMLSIGDVEVSRLLQASESGGAMKIMSLSEETRELIFIERNKWCLRPYKWYRIMVIKDFP
jgi:hypothetical protein